jgi:hypothetical protein
MLVARIKSGTCPEYLTVGKEYRVIGRPNDGDLFDIKPDFGLEWISCYAPNCPHLSNGSWELYEKPSLPFAASDGEKGEMPVEVV